MSEENIASMCMQSFKDQAEYDKAHGITDRNSAYNIRNNLIKMVKELTGIDLSSLNEENAQLKAQIKERNEEIERLNLCFTSNETLIGVRGYIIDDLKLKIQALRTWLIIQKLNHQGIECYSEIDISDVECKIKEIFGEE